jgi:hypothetical protein
VAAITPKARRREAISVGELDFSAETGWSSGIVIEVPVDRLHHGKKP